MTQTLPSFMRPVGSANWAKRAFDIVASSFALILLSPVLIASAVAIRANSSGPALFRQRRIGMGGETFTMLKFRTMFDKSADTIHRQAIAKAWSGKHLSDDPAAPFKLTNDPRVTGVGAFLRKSSIDELPQLINVLRGEMSLVGPRPMIPYEVTGGEEWFGERHSVLPGITGLAQIKCRGRATMHEIIKHDLKYVHSRTFCKDLKIILQTVPVVVRGIGAR